MGDTKFIPDIDVEVFENILKASNAFKKEQNVIENLWSKCKTPIFQLTDRTKSLGLASDGITTYFSDNCTKQDSDSVNEWLKLKKIEGYICRTFKTVNNGQSTFDIRLASTETGPKEGITYESEEYKGNLFQVSRGDYTGLLKLVNNNLLIAKNHAANDNQVKMIEEYVRSFTEGSLEAHKEGSR